MTRVVPRLLVMAKAPVPGAAKTRLAPAVGFADAAELAATALLDTLDTVAAASRELGSGPPAVALAGDLDAAVRAVEIRVALHGFRVLPQHGRGFDERLVAAHLEAAGPAGGPVLQIGMDTPQVSVELLAECANRLQVNDCVLGPAPDGGWWLLGVRRAAFAGALIGVPMSTPTTGLETAAALRRAGRSVATGPGLRDVDTIEDAWLVAADAPDTRFAALLAELGRPALPAPAGAL